VAHHVLLLHGLLRGRPWPEAAEAQTKEPATGNSGETGQSLAGGGSSSSNVADHGPTWSRDSGRTRLRKEKGRSLTEATAFVPNVTECYIQVTLRCFSGILRSGKVLMVFFGYGDLSML